MTGKEREALIAELGAYLDKEASTEEAQATERKLFQDADALALLRALRDDQTRLKAELDPVAGATPPDRLLETIREGFEGRQGDRGASGGRGGAPWWALAAASVVFLMLGAGSGLWWAESRLGQALSTYEARAELERGIIASTVNKALETRVSGEPVAWESGDTSGQVVPLRTYRSRSGHWCREYERTTHFQEGPITVLALACRTGDGQWVTIRAEPREAGDAL